ncbi:MAG: ATP-binding cassette domain-containing protein, partial [Spirochaetales bacterium]
MPDERQYIEFDRFSYLYGQVPALINISLRIPRGAFVSVVGESGGGKSTLLRALNRLLDLHGSGRHSGDIRFGDVSIFNTDIGAERARRRTAMVFEEPYLFPGTVFENIVYPLRADGIWSKRKLRRRVAEALSALGLEDTIGRILQRRAAELSTPVAQTVSLVRAVIREPDLLILDDPTERHDPVASNRLETLIRLAGDATTVVMSTSDLQQARRCSDFIVMLEGGQLVDLVTVFEGQTRSLARARPRYEGGPVNAGQHQV